MDIFNVLTMIGGLALFLYGMDVMGKALSKVSGGKLESILERLTANKLMAILLGAGVTAVIQSSSATTVMVVGFVNSGIMKLSQAIGVIMGANVGTTMTAWILSLTGIQGDNFWVQLVKPSSFTPILAVIGIGLIMFSQKERKKDIGTILIGFAVLMFGMDTMSDAVKPLAGIPEFSNILLMFSNPILGMLAGMALTAIIQSSSASIGILQALSVTGAVSYATALPIIMGQNIGTCITAMLSSIGTNKNARRAALVHLFYNIISAIAFMILFYSINYFVEFAFLQEAASTVGIAAVHTLFNLFAVVIFFPFTSQLEKLTYLMIKDVAEEEDKKQKEKEVLTILEPRFLTTPGFALEQSKTAANAMADYAEESLLTAIKLFDKYSEKAAKRVVELEEIVDYYEDQLGSYLMKLSSKDISDVNSQELSILLHCIGDFERISDHALNIMEAAKEMYDKDLHFSKRAEEELVVFFKAIKEVVGTMIKAFKGGDLALAEKIEPLEEVIDGLNVEMKKRHVKRLRKGKCTIELGFILADITTNCERVSDHCSNVGLSLLHREEDDFDTHEYQNDMRSKGNIDFKKEVHYFKEKYRLPSKNDDKK